VIQVSSTQIVWMYFDMACQAPSALTLRGGVSLLRRAPTYLGYPGEFGAFWGGCVGLCGLAFLLLCGVLVGDFDGASDGCGGECCGDEPGGEEDRDHDSLPFVRAVVTPHVHSWSPS